MQIKGTAFLARQRFVIETYGQNAWDTVFDRVSSKHPALKKIVLASSLLPAQDFLALQDAICSELCQNDKRPLWTMGQKSAEWAFSEGPFKGLLNRKQVAEFTKMVPSIWRAYYTEAAASADVNEAVVGLHIRELPFYHIYFEDVAAAFIQRSLELVTGAPAPAHRSAFSPDHRSISYNYQIQERK